MKPSCDQIQAVLRVTLAWKTLVVGCGTCKRLESPLLFFLLLPLVCLSVHLCYRYDYRSLYVCRPDFSEDHAFFNAMSTNKFCHLSLHQRQSTEFTGANEETIFDVSTDILTLLVVKQGLM